MWRRSSAQPRASKSQARLRRKYVIGTHNPIRHLALVGMMASLDQLTPGLAWFLPPSVSSVIKTGFQPTETLCTYNMD